MATKKSDKNAFNIVVYTSAKSSSKDVAAIIRKYLPQYCIEDGIVSNRITKVTVTPIGEK